VCDKVICSSKHLKGSDFVLLANNENGLSSCPRDRGIKKFNSWNPRSVRGSGEKPFLIPCDEIKSPVFKLNSSPYS
jgi:hypothetical protein